MLILLVAGAAFVGMMAAIVAVVVGSRSRSKRRAAPSESTDSSLPLLSPLDPTLSEPSASLEHPHHPHHSHGSSPSDQGSGTERSSHHHSHHETDTPTSSSSDDSSGGSSSSSSDSTDHHHHH